MEQNNKKNVYPCKPNFYYINVGGEGVFVTRTCFRDATVAALDLGIFCPWLNSMGAVIILKLYGINHTIMGASLNYLALYEFHGRGHNLQTIGI